MKPNVGPGERMEVISKYLGKMANAAVKFGSGPGMGRTLKRKQSIETMSFDFIL